MKEINVKIKLFEGGKMPVRKHPEDMGADCYARSEVGAETICIPPHSSVMIPLGFATELPEGWGYYLHVRSSVGCKQNLRLANCTGVIDEGYRDEVKACIFNDSDEIKTINTGERVCQIVFHEVPRVTFTEVDKLGGEDRGGGFGSTNE